jgi:hypothetical protein
MCRGVWEFLNLHKKASCCCLTCSQHNRDHLGQGTPAVVLLLLPLLQVVPENCFCR